MLRMHIEGTPAEFFGQISQAERAAINMMQVKLIARLLGDIHSVDEEIQWVEKYSKAFRETIVEHYELVEEFGRDERSTLEKIEAMLYHHEEPERKVA